MSLSFYLSPKGRVSRSELWLKFSLPFMGLLFIAGFADGLIGTYDEESGLGLLSSIFLLVSLWPSTVVPIKRLHDLNLSGWYLLTMFIPIWSVWSSLKMLFVPGHEGDNYYGSDPREKGGAVETLESEAVDAGLIG